MDEMKRHRLKNSVIEQIKKHQKYHDAYEDIVNVYVGMLLEQEELRQKLSDPISEESRVILLEVLQTLAEDISDYADRLEVGG